MAYVRANRAEVVDDQEAPKPAQTDKFACLAEWVLSKTEPWRTWRDSNYEAQWSQFERLWRGIWSSDDRSRSSERSKIVTPALSEAVENAAAEIEEAVFGRGSDYFDIEVDRAALAAAEPAQPALPAAPGGMMAAGGPPMPMAPMAAAVQAAVSPEDAVQTTRESLRDDLQRSDFAANCSEVVLYAAVFGTGFGEIVTKSLTIKTPTPDGLGSNEVTLDVPSLRALSPRNVLVDPNAKRLEDGLGVAIEEEVSQHLLLEQQAAGDLRREIDLRAPAVESDPDLSGDQYGSSKYEQDKVHVTRWYGRVPTKLLYPENHKREDGAYPSVQDAEDGDYTEALVIITNKRDVAKAVENPWPRQDRPVVYFPWDVVPGRLHGRGICEKGAASQRILDTEVRARLDGIALTWAPMVGLDATRIPRGAKFQVNPGASILTNGDPDTVIRPIKIGQLDPNHWQNAQALQGMVHQATGSIDATRVANNVGDARSGAVSMAMAPIIKRYKRTLVRFFDLFLMPALDKIVSRSQQAMPKRYPAVAARLRPASTMGIMQREYETSQLTTLLATLQPGSAEHRAVLMGVVSNTSIPNREAVLKLIATAEEREAALAQAATAAQQNPMMQQLQQATIELELEEKKAKIRKLQAEAQLAETKAEMLPAEIQVDAMSTATKGMYSVPEAQQATEFDRRMAIADRVLEGERIAEQARDRESNERITAAQMAMSAAEKERDRQLKARLELTKARAKAQQPQRPSPTK